IQDWLARKGKLPEETQHYVKTITGRPAENWKAAKAASSVQNVPRQAPCQEATGLIASNEPQRADVATRSRAMLPHVKAPAYRSAGVRAVPPS
ncbi:MAG: hypothetical protein WBW28_16390, partial [Pseudolabrys sp.]